MPATIATTPAAITAVQAEPKASSTGLLGRWMVRGVVLMVLLVPAAGAIAWCLASADPVYWSQVDLTDPEVHQRVRLLEEKLAEALSQPRPSQEEWILELEQDELRDWMAIRMPEWLQEHGVQQSLPPWLDQPMVVFKDNTLVVAGRVTHEKFAGVVSMEFEPVPGPDGRVELQMAGASAGRLPLPQDLLDKLVKRTGSVEAAREYAVGQAREELKSVALPVIELSDGRKVQVTDIKLSSGRVQLVCRTLAAPEAVALADERS